MPIAARLGVRKLRVTGGEPLLRKNLSTLIRKLAAIEGIEDLAMTTNGVLLAQQAEELYDAGLRRINVHLGYWIASGSSRLPGDDFDQGDGWDRNLPHGWLRAHQNYVAAVEESD